ncbi:MAG: hypothetical protein IAE80_15470 [Anaerolinea sp.]|nr:hypothetical protein [Anaerolinea sp.]
MTQTNPMQDHPDWDAYDDYTGPEPERIIDDPALPFTLHDDLVPIDRNGMYVPNHLDESGTLHVFAAVDHTDRPEFDSPVVHLSYIRAMETEDGRLVYDKHPVMPLADMSDQPFPRQTLDLMLMDGDLENAQELAHQTARSHGLAFPEHESLPPLDTAVRYDFAGGVEDDGSPALLAVKSWREGSVDREQRLTIASYGMAAALDVDLRELDEVRDGFGLQTAMNLAESMAVASGYLHDGRDDTRLFTEGPPDPFTTNAERERAAEVFIGDAGELDTEELPAAQPAPSSIYAQWAADAQSRREANMPLEGAAWFEATFADNAKVDLLQPINDTVNYAVVVTDSDPWTTELMVEKFWREPGGYVGSDSLTIDTYDSDDEVQRDVAEAARATLLGIHEKRGLEAMMHQAELGAMENRYLDGDRADTRLFHDGPPDRFETLAHRVEGTPNLYWNTTGERIESPRDETQELPAVTPERVYLLDEADMGQPAPDSWDALIAAQADEEPAREAHYWQMHYRPVETPEGEPLGTALFVTAFPQLPPDFDDYIDEFGMDDTVYPTEARTLEMAHFASEVDAKKFDAEFRGYLVSGLLDGPELAPEVAKLEGLSGEWQDMDYDDIVGYMSGRRTVVRAESEWHLHNPNAEREAEMSSAGIPLLSDEELVQIEPDDPAPTPDFDL